MKKIYLLILSLLCLSSLAVFAASPCDSEQGYSGYYSQNNGYYNNQKSCNKPCKKHYQTPCQTPCEKTYQTPCQTPCQADAQSECFLCTNRNMNSIFSQMNLSETQMCTAMKIQDKYALEVLSINERIQCEKQNLSLLKQKCAKRSEMRKQNRTISRLKKDRKKICKCYEDQFKAILSDEQKKAYKKAKK